MLFNQITYFTCPYMSIHYFWILVKYLSEMVQELCEKLS